MPRRCHCIAGLLALKISWKLGMQFASLAISRKQRKEVCRYLKNSRGRTAAHVKNFSELLSRGGGLMEWENLLYKVEDSVAILTLNSPSNFNAFSPSLVRELSKALEVIEAEEEIKVVILTGGEKVFAAGGDIAGMLEMGPLDAERYSAMVQNVLNQVESLSKPVIAAVAGSALGGGCELAMACDLRIAATNATFGQPEVELGIMPGAGATKRLARLVGPAIAKELIFTGRIIKADAAYEIGLVNKVVPPDQLMTEALNLAQIIARKPPSAIRLAKTTLNIVLETDLFCALELERRGFAILFSTEDKREGMRAFLEKRKPVFRGY